MKNHEIDQPEDLSCRKPAGAHKISPKRRKREESNSQSSSTSGTVSVLQTRESRLLRAKLETLCARLSKTAADSIEFYEIRIEIDEIVEKQKSLLQLASNAELIKKLQRHLEAAMRSNDKLLQALMTAESKSSQRKTTMERMITVLLAEIDRLKARAISGEISDGRESLKRQVKAIQDGIAKLDHQLRGNLIIQKELDVQDSELAISLRKLKTLGKRKKQLKSNSTPQNGSNCYKINPSNANCEVLKSLLTESMSATDSDEDLEYSRDIISTLQAAVEERVPFEEQVSPSPEELEDPEKAEAVRRLEAEFEEIRVRLTRNQSSDRRSGAIAQVNSPQQVQAIPLIHIDRDECWETYDTTIENKYPNPSDNDFPSYSPSDDGALPEQRIDRVSEVDDVHKNNEGMWKKCKSVGTSLPGMSVGTSLPGMIGVPDWLLSPAASSIAISTEKSPSCSSDEMNGTSSPDSYASSGTLSPDSDALEIVEQSHPYERLKLAVGKHSVLVSSSKYFELKWNSECAQIKGNKWICRQCSHVESCKSRMEDHVWIKHHGGHYKCPHCPFKSERNHYNSRGFSGGHYKSKHPHLIEGFEQKPRNNGTKC